MSCYKNLYVEDYSGADIGGGCRGCAPPPEMTCGFLLQLIFCKKKKKLWFIGVEVKQETSAPPLHPLHSIYEINIFIISSLSIC